MVSSFQDKVENEKCFMCVYICSFFFVCKTREDESWARIYVRMDQITELVRRKVAKVISTFCIDENRNPAEVK